MGRSNFTSRSSWFPWFRRCVGMTKKSLFFFVGEVRDDGVLLKEINQRRALLHPKKNHKIQKWNLKIGKNIYISLYRSTKKKTSNSISQQKKRKRKIRGFPFWSPFFLVFFGGRKLLLFNFGGGGFNFGGGPLCTQECWGGVGCPP